LKTADEQDANTLNNAAWACAYLPAALPDIRAAVSLAEQAVALDRAYGRLNTLGSLLYRAGRYEDAIRSIDEGIKLHGKGGMGWDWLFLAMAHHRLGRQDEARKWLDKAVAWTKDVDAGKIQESYIGAKLQWNYRLELQMFTREAEELINGGPQHKESK
jgi:tetratricopeptide (TPR) repeat protein